MALTLAAQAAPSHRHQQRTHARGGRRALHLEARSAPRQGGRPSLGVWASRGHMTCTGPPPRFPLSQQASVVGTPAHTAA